MSWDLSLNDPEKAGEYIDLGNYTHNTNRMLELANGFHWSQLEGDSPAIAANKIEALLIYLVLHREECEELNPENGWGSYDGVLRFAQSVYTRCKKETLHPTDDIKRRFHAYG